jgi:hypothetical protein
MCGKFGAIFTLRKRTENNVLIEIKLLLDEFNQTKPFNFIILKTFSRAPP